MLTLLNRLPSSTPPRTGVLPSSFAESLKFCEDLCLFDLSNNDKIEGTDDFRDTLRKYLPM